MIGPGTQNLERLVRQRLQVFELFDHAQTVGRCNFADNFVTRILVVSRRAEGPLWRNFVEPAHEAVEILDEITTTHLTVCENIDSCFLLIEQCHVDGVVERFLDIRFSEIAALFGAFGCDPQPTG